MRALILSLALALPAAADHVKPYKDASQILVPPAQYDPRLHPYTGKFSRVWASHAEVIAMCGIGPVLACAKRSGWNATLKRWNKCTVIMPNNLPLDLRRAVNIHEVAHCNSWVHTGGSGTVAGLHEDDTHDHGGEE